MASHTIFVDHLPPDEATTTRITGDEARHAARAKRLREGAAIRLIDGKGAVCLARITSARRDIDLELISRETHLPITPVLELCTATPKGPRLDKMIDMLSQCGTAMWRPLETALGVVDPGAGKIDRMGRIAIESAKQSGRAWLMTVGRAMPFADAIVSPSGINVVIADSRGEPYSPSRAEKIRVLIGPEGGFTDQEIETAISSGAGCVSLGPGGLRIETAAVAAASVIMHAEHCP